MTKFKDFKLSPYQQWHFSMTSPNLLTDLNLNFGNDDRPFLITVVAILIVTPSIITSVLTYLLVGRSRSNNNDRVLDAIKGIKTADTSYSTSNDADGYVFFDVDEKNKTHFMDVFVGFDNFTRAKGYETAVSFKSDLPGKIGLKISILNYGITVSIDKVKNDVDEYILRVMNNDDLSDMPMVTNNIDHNKIISALRMRFNHLKHQIELSKLTNDAYHKIIENYSMIVERGIVYYHGNTAQTVQIGIHHGGSTMSGDSYTSGQAGAMGPGSSAVGNTIQQIWNQNASILDLKKLSVELKTLYRVMESEEKTAEQKISMANIGVAHATAEAGDGLKTIEYLRSSGKWAFDKATAIGVGVAAGAIKTALGL